MINIGNSTSKWAQNNKIEHEFLETTTSTNILAKEGGLKSNPSWLYLANTQTQGKGRHSNTWSNTKNIGDQLLSTWCFSLNSSPQPISSSLFGWALYKSLNDEFDLNISIKAPNDIYINSKKLAGILLESISQGSKHYICVGIGLNVNQAPKDIDIATSLIEEIGTDISETRWHSFLNSLYINLKTSAQLCQDKEIPSLLTSEILIALKKWPRNEVKLFKPNANLVLNDGSEIVWSNL